MPGAGTVIGTSAVAKAPADGYTLLIIANSFLINNKLQKELPYDGLNAFVPVAMLLDSPQVLAVNASSPYQTFSQLLELSRQTGANFSYSTVGPNTSQNIAGELLKARSGMVATYVPFAGWQRRDGWSCHDGTHQLERDQRQHTGRQAAPPGGGDRATY